MTTDFRESTPEHENAATARVRSSSSAPSIARSRLLRSRADTWNLLLLAVLGVLFFRELAFMEGVPIARDMQLFFVPWKHVVWEALRAGRLPLWTSRMALGIPTLADFQSAVFYPPTWLYAVLPFLAAFNWLLVLHVLLGGAGMYLLCRELEFSPPASLVAGLSFMLGGYFVSLTNLINALQAAAWAPLLILVLLRQVRRPGIGRWTVVLAVYVLAFLSGAPQTFLLGALVAALYVLVAGWREHRLRRSARRLALTLASVAPVAIGIAMVQILPTVIMVRHSGRASGLHFSEVMRYSLDPVRLVHLLVPNDFHDPVYRFGLKMQLSGQDPWLFSIYLGVATLALACFALSDRRRRREVGPWCALAVVGVVLALGWHTPVLPWIYAHAHALNAFRYPEKYFLFTGLAVPVLAAHGFDVLRRGGRGSRGTHLALLALLALLLSARLVWGLAPTWILDSLRQQRPLAPLLSHFSFAYVRLGHDLDRVALLGALAVSVLLLTEGGRFDPRWLALLLPAIVALDFWMAHRNLTPVADPHFYDNTPEIAGQLPMQALQTNFRYYATPFDKHTGSFYSMHGLSVESEHWMWRETMAPNTGVLFGVNALDATDAIHPTLRMQMDDMFRSLPLAYAIRLLRLSSVISISNPHAFQNEALEKPRPVPSLNTFVYRMRDPVPRAHLARGQFASGEMEALNQVLAPGFEPRSQVVLLHESVGSGPPRPSADSGSLRSAPGPTAGPGTAKVLSDRGSSVQIRVRPEVPSYLVLHDLYYPGWHAYVDGQERPIYRADYFFRAVAVRPGDREVVFRYRPRWLVIGGWISGATLVAIVGAILWVAVGRREPRVPSEPGAGGHPGPADGSLESTDGGSGTRPLHRGIAR